MRNFLLSEILSCFQYEGFLNIFFRLALVMLVCIILPQKVAFNSNICYILDLVKGLLCISICLQERKKSLLATAAEGFIV